MLGVTSASLVTMATRDGAHLKTVSRVGVPTWRRGITFYTGVSTDPPPRTEMTTSVCHVQRDKPESTATGKTYLDLYCRVSLLCDETEPQNDFRAKIDKLF